jgi:hypothetical protein
MSLSSAVATVIAAAIAENFADLARAPPPLPCPPCRLSSPLLPPRPSPPPGPPNLEAEFGQITGQVLVVKCTHYASRSGVQTVYIVMAGFFGVSYANCYYGSEGACCSLRTYS